METHVALYNYVQQIVIWTFGLVEKANLVILREKPPDQLKNHFFGIIFSRGKWVLKVWFIPVQVLEKLT